MESFKYFSHTEEDIKEMLKVINVSSIDELFSYIPKEVLLEKNFSNPGLSEHELRKYITNISLKNKQLISFRGCGCLDSYNLSVVDSITSRSEFLTSYTPYQPEISQGTLQYIFEFQSLVCELTGLDCSNASMYDSSTAFCESILMAVNQTRKNKVILSKSINPNYLEVIKTYMKYKNIELIFVDLDNYTYSKEDLLSKLDNDISCVCFQYPNYYGYIEDYDFVDILKEKNIKFILNSDISVFSVLKTPKELGVDIVCGDLQAFGIPLSFGGPNVGYISSTNEFLRKLPGRIVGLTNDVDGKRGFVLTLQAREQHIRREKANSNICSNESLVALMSLIYASLLGPTGLIKTQKKAYHNANYLEKALLNTKLFNKVTTKPYLKEFTLESKLDLVKLNKYLEKHSYLSGQITSNNLIIFSCSEVRTKAEIDDFVRKIEEFSHE